MIARRGAGRPLGQRYQPQHQQQSIARRARDGESKLWQHVFQPGSEYRALNFALGSLHGASYTLTPSVNLRYLFAAYDGYTETGSTANLTVAGRNMQNIEERASAQADEHQRAIAPGRVLVASIYGGVIGVQRADGAISTRRCSGQQIPFATPGKDSVIGGFGGAGIEWHSGRTTLFGSIEYMRFSDSSSVISGRGGVKVAF